LLHREELRQALSPQQLANPKLMFFDAEAQLSKFTVDEWPRELVEEMLTPARQHGSVRIFGEMVAVLWAKGSIRAALRLEELWNKLVEDHAFALLCAYPVSTFSGDNDALPAISRLYTHVHTQSPLNRGCGMTS